MANATGWNELMDGTLIKAAFVMYDTAFLGWTVALLFFVYQIMLFYKTRNLTICLITGLFFASMYAVSTFVKTISVQVIFVLLVFELGGILYFWLWK